MYLYKAFAWNVEVFLGPNLSGLVYLHTPFLTHYLCAKNMTLFRFQIMETFQNRSKIKDVVVDRFT
jgi:hypothetical protein